MTAYQSMPQLEPEQQKLLLAALNSQKQKNPSEQHATAEPSINPSVLDSVLQDWPADALPSLTFDENYPFTNPIATDLPTPALQQTYRKDSDDSQSPDEEFDIDYGAEKRKSPDDNDDAEEQDDGEAKRQENEDRAAKKPGRKLLTAEPTTKRKAQNRAAQRAFRERKEKHLKDLETKVSDLEHASESANHENGILRAQIERLQTELREYRKRVSLTGSFSSSPPRVDSYSSSSPNNADFNFNFPRFGTYPAPQAPRKDLADQDARSSSWSNGASQTINTTRNGNTANQRVQSPFSFTSGAQASNDPLQSLFSPSGSDVLGDFSFGTQVSNSPTSTVNGPSNGSYSSKQSHSSPSHSGSVASPPSSVDNQGNNSSCCTSPDPLEPWQTNYSPAIVAANGFTKPTGKGNSNPQTNNTDTSQGAFDWLALQGDSNFDPVLFGNYREPQEAIVGNGNDFSSGFFDDSSLTNGLFPDFGDPFNFNLSADTTVPAPVQAPSPGQIAQTGTAQQKQKKGNDLMEQVRKQQEGEQSSAPSAGEEDNRELMTCHKIWNQLQNCPQFKSGEFDIDSLCTELASKARCTTTGVAVPKHYVEKALWRLAGSSAPVLDNSDSPTAPKQSTVDPQNPGQNRNTGGLAAMFPGLA